MFYISMFSGWLSWERFRCNTDCENDPDNCIRWVHELIDLHHKLIMICGYFISSSIESFRAFRIYLESI